MTNLLLSIELPAGGRFEHRLVPGSYVIGRAEGSCDIPILSPEISRQHVRLTLTEAQCTVEDLGSTSGTMHQGQAVTGSKVVSYPLELHLGTVLLQIAVVTQTAEQSGSAGHYTKGKAIAQGGMGAVLEANDQLLGRTVAMKVVRHDIGDSESIRLRFIREATVLARLEHPSIVPIYEMGKDTEGRLYYTMKKVEGRTLQTILDDLKKGEAETVKEYTLDRLLSVFRKMCDAMAFAHAKGVIHRDLKPENVMVGEYGEVLVMDWGLAKVLYDVAQSAVELQLSTQAPGSASVTQMPTPFQELSDSLLSGSSQNLTLDGAVMGSPQYMPPEQAEGRVGEIDERSDIFSLGGILYAILTLKPPVEGRTVKEVLDKVKSGKITPPTHFNTGSSSTNNTKLPKGNVRDPKLIIPLPHCPGGRVPSALSSVTMKALAFDREHRYGSVGELAADVEAYQRGFATSAENISAMGQVTLFVKRHKGIAVSAGVAVLLITILSVGFVFKVNAEKKAALAAEARANQKAIDAATAEALQKVEALKARAAEQAAVASLAQSKISLAEAAYRIFDMQGMAKSLQECPPGLRDHSWSYLNDKQDSSLGFFAFPPVTNISAALAIPGQHGRFALAGRDQHIIIATIAAEQAIERLASGILGDKVLAVSRDAGTMAVGDRNGTEVNLLDMKSHSVIGRFKADGNAINSLSLNHDGSLLAVTYLKASNSGGVQVFDTKQSKSLWSIAAGLLSNAILHPTEEIVMVGDSSNRNLELRSARDGTMFFKRFSGLRCMALSQDGNRLAIGGMVGLVMIVDSRTGTKLQQGTLHTGKVQDLVWTAENTLVTVGEEGEATRIAMWDAEDFSHQGSLFGLPNIGELAVFQVALDPASGFMITLGPTTQLWRVPVDLEISKIFHRSEQGVSGCFISDSTLLASDDWSSRAFDVSDPSNPKPMGNTVGRGQAISASHWETGVFVTAGAFGKKATTLQLLKMEGGVPKVQWSHPEKLVVKALDFDPSGRRVMAASGRRVEIFDVSKGSLIKSFPSTGLRFAGQDGQRMLGIGSRTRTEGGVDYLVELLDAETGNAIRSITNQSALSALAVSPDRKLAAIAGMDYALEILDADTLESRIRFRAHDKKIGAMAFHPTKPVIASASSDGSVKLWNINTGQLVRQFMGIRGEPLSLAFSPSGHLLSVEGRENFVRNFDTGQIADTTEIGTFTTKTTTASVRPRAYWELPKKNIAEITSDGSINEPVVKNADGWEDLLATLTPERVEQTGTGWRLDGGALRSPQKTFAALRLPGRVAGASYQVSVKLRRTARRDFIYVLLPVGDRAAGFALDLHTGDVFYSGVSQVDGKTGADMPGAANGLQINDEEPHALLITVRLDDSIATISTQLDGKPLYEWKGPINLLSRAANWSEIPTDALALGTRDAEWIIAGLKVKRLDGN